MDHNLPTWMHPCNWPNKFPNHSKIFGFGLVTMMFTGILEWRQKNKNATYIWRILWFLGPFLENSLIPKIQIWKDFFHKQVVEGLGYVPGVCWNFLRLILNHLYFCDLSLVLPTGNFMEVVIQNNDKIYITRDFPCGFLGVPLFCILYNIHANYMQYMHIHCTHINPFMVDLEPLAIRATRTEHSNTRHLWVPSIGFACMSKSTIAKKI